MKVQKLFLQGMFLIFLVGLISGSYTLGVPTNLIAETYGQGGIISGWINISFNNESVNSLFEGNFRGGVSLRELLDDSSYDYKCFPDGCGNYYSVSGNSATT